ncbi:MAG: M28 family peptidase [Nannocystis sp.]|nr:M28 family peptidase [Nannocystis sp.]
MLNVEARGTTGVSRMFESSRGAALIAAFAAGAPRPSATSLAVEIYRRMPNDTDLSVFLGEGVPGLNFGFIGGVARYHTPRDDLAHLDLRSVQQQGDAPLRAARALLAADSSLAPAGAPGLHRPRRPPPPPLARPAQPAARRGRPPRAPLRRPPRVFPERHVSQNMSFITID